MSRRKITAGRQNKGRSERTVCRTQLTQWEELTTTELMFTLYERQILVGNLDELLMHLLYVMEEQRHKEIADERKQHVVSSELPTTELILHYINLNKYLTVILMKLLMHLLRLTKPQNLQVRMIKEIQKWIYTKI